MKKNACRRTGSSPLARGLPQNRDHRLASVRIIPARAGFTANKLEQTQETRDHPRSRGVYASGGRDGWAGAGSSPLARGLLVTKDKMWRVRGIIPARAGFTFHERGQFDHDRDHPRSRGVYSSIAFLAPLEGGIIPARAGFTPCRRRGYSGTADHPRSRGVYLAIMFAPFYGVGSSPLARGLREESPWIRLLAGIIPARAGFTSTRSLPGRANQDHPRSRGVYSSGSMELTPQSGSSPLARGLLVAGDTVRARHGIIPARAGFTLFFGPAYAPYGDHPRSRGVYKT